jgi:hypothetical protein
MRESGSPEVKRSDPLEIRFQLRTGTLGNEVDQTPRVATGRFPRITQVLALAIYFDDLIRKSEATAYADIARRTCLSRERISQLMRLNHLAPDIQVEVLYLPPTPTGKYPISETALRGVANLLSWPDQRLKWGRIKEDLNGNI